MLQPLTEMGRGLSMSRRFVEDEACVVSLSRGDKEASTVDLGRRR